MSDAKRAADLAASAEATLRRDRDDPESFAQGVAHYKARLGEEIVAQIVARIRAEAAAPSEAAAALAKRGSEPRSLPPVPAWKREVFKQAQSTPMTSAYSVGGDPGVEEFGAGAARPPVVDAREVAAILARKAEEQGTDEAQRRRDAAKAARQEEADRAYEAALDPRDAYAAKALAEKAVAQLDLLPALVGVYSVSHRLRMTDRRAMRERLLVKANGREERASARLFARVVLGRDKQLALHVTEPADGESGLLAGRPILPRAVETGGPEEQVLVVLGAVVEAVLAAAEDMPTKEEGAALREIVERLAPLVEDLRRGASVAMVQARPVKEGGAPVTNDEVNAKTAKGLEQIQAFESEIDANLRRAAFKRHPFRETWAFCGPYVTWLAKGALVLGVGAALLGVLGVAAARWLLPALIWAWVAASSFVGMAGLVTCALGLVALLVAPFLAGGWRVGSGVAGLVALLVGGGLSAAAPVTVAPVGLALLSDDVRLQPVGGWFVVRERDRLRVVDSKAREVRGARGRVVDLRVGSGRSDILTAARLDALLDEADRQQGWRERRRNAETATQEASLVAGFWGRVLEQEGKILFNRATAVQTALAALQQAEAPFRAAVEAIDAAMAPAPARPGGALSSQQQAALNDLLRVGRACAAELDARVAAVGSRLDAMVRALTIDDGQAWAAEHRRWLARALEALPPEQSAPVRANETYLASVRVTAKEIGDAAVLAARRLNSVQARIPQPSAPAPSGAPAPTCPAPPTAPAS